jgi:hypothetical protein
MSHISPYHSNALSDALKVIGEQNGFPIDPFPVCARVSYFGTVCRNMTIIAALITGRDAVVAADGLARRSDGRTDVQAVKVCRLRRGVLLGCVGDSSHAKYMLCALDSRASRLDPVSVLDKWEASLMNCPRRLEAVRRRLWAAYQKLCEHLLEEDPNRSRWPHYLLAGRCMGGVGFTVFRVSASNGKNSPEHDSHDLTRGSREQVLITLGAKQGDPALDAMIAKTQADVATRDEVRLVRHIRGIRSLSQFRYRVNDNILVRMLSDKERRHWHLAVG